MRKIAYVLLNLLELALFLGGYIIHYFTVRKMGMIRYVVYINHKLEEKYPLSIIKGIIILLIIILTILVFGWFLIHVKELKRIVIMMNIVMVFLSVITVSFILFYKTDILREYYFISLLLSIAAFLQILKTSIGNKICKFKLKSLR